MASGVDLSAARKDLEIIADRLERQYPENQHKSVSLTPLRERLSASAGPTLLLLLGATFCVLLVACANVANLQRQATKDSLNSTKYTFSWFTSITADLASLGSGFLR